jgi:hypothetical protein
MISKSHRWLAALPLLTALAVPAHAGVEPQGTAFRVNVTNDFRQQNPVSAFAPTGNALVVWENDQKGIRGLFQSPSGAAVSAELTLVANQTIPGSSEGPVRTRKDPAVGFLKDGSFLLAWTEERAYLRTFPFIEERQVQDRDIHVQRFNANGTPAGEPVRVNTFARGFQSVPKLVVRPSGDAILVWRQESAGLTALDGVNGRLVNASGRPVGPELRVSGNPSADHVAVAATAKGFLVTWEILTNGQNDVFARLYDASARPVGAEFRVNPSTEGQQRWPAVAAGKDGNFLVAWQSYLTDRSIVRIFGQFVGPAGGFLGASFLISTDEGTGQLAPALAPTPQGGFLVAWLDWTDLNQLGINAVEINATGGRVGDEFWIAETKVRKNYRTSLAANGTGGYLMPWETNFGTRQVIAARVLGQ